MIPGSANALLLASAAAAEEGISRSVRFNSADSAYLSRTFSSGNRRTFTFALWVKRSGIDSASRYLLLSSYGAGSTYTTIEFSTNNVWLFDGSAISAGISTAAVFRDPSAWMHIVFSVDTTQATASNRVKIYINGTQQTVSGTQPSQNSDLYLNQANSHIIGAINAGGFFHHFNGYLADVHFIDGQALTADSFGEPDATTGVWNPIAYTGTYGTNGFHLDFADNSTAAALGTDSAGSNDWTVNNISVTAGAGNDSLVDVPTNGTASTGGDPGGSTRGNYCTLNPLTNGGTLSNGNLDFTAGAAHCLAKSTFAIPTSGLWYAELTVGSSTNASVALGFGLGAASLATNAVASSASNSWNFYGYSSIIINRNDGGNTYSGSFTAGDIIQIAVDPANNRAWVGQNNTWRDGSSGTTGNPSTGSNPTFTSLPADLFLVVNAYSNSGYLNCGQRPFAYSPPSGGYKALCTANLPAPVITKPSEYMDVVTYTGNGSYPRTISGLGFSPDLIWTKVRSQAYRHMVADIVRGTAASLTTNNPSAESLSDAYGWVSAFNSDGWQIQQGSVSGENFNANNDTYVAWNWDAGSSTVTNTQGSITSSVRANPSAGFSIVTYTGNGSAGATVGHGLNVAPQLLINKRRSSTGTTADWAVWHKSVADISGSSYVLFLNTTDAALSASNRFNSTAPTSSVFTLGNADATNYNGGTFVTYCFAPVSGYSAFGSFDGSSSTQYIYTGFLPRYLVIKCYAGSSSQEWIIKDTARNPYNAANYYLTAESSNNEGSSARDCDFLSNGFSVPGNIGPMNYPGRSYVYFAFAESPFNFSRAR